MKHRYTYEQVEFIMCNYKNHKINKLLIAFNQKFQTNLTLKQLGSKIQSLKVRKRNLQKSFGKYTKEMLDWLIQNHNTMKFDEFTVKFNATFNTTFTKSALWHKTYRLLDGAITRTTEKIIPRTAWTEEMESWIKTHYNDAPYKNLADLMNEKFNTKITSGSIEHKICRLGLKKSIEAIKKQHKRHSNFWYQKGRIPNTKKPIGYERITKQGIIWIKVKEPDVFMAKHRFIYESYHGKIPKGYAVIFADGNKKNLAIENLILVSRSVLAVLNKNHLIKNSKELTETGIMIAKLMSKVYKLKIEHKKDNCELKK